jgi:hypothetical protein
VPLFELSGSLCSNYLPGQGRPGRSCADDQDIAGGFDRVGSDGVKIVDGHDAGDLVHQAFDESEVAAGDADDRDDGFGVAGSVGFVGDAEFLPVPTVGVSGKVTNTTTTGLSN